MIKLQRGPAPACLSAADVLRLTTEYAATKSSVWNFPDLKGALLDLSAGKCAYCECELQTQATYMEVEHFVSKDLDPTLVVEWTNLLPACKRCNVHKSIHDVRVEPIVNPFSEIPSNHLALRLYRVVPTTPKGATTIDVLHLNDSDRLVVKRFEIGTALLEALEQVRERAEAYVDAPTVRRRNRLRGMLKGILMECQAASSFAATGATVLHNDENYRVTRDILINEGVWDAEFTSLHDESLQLVM